jgi:hypothetical protein
MNRPFAVVAVGTAALVVMSAGAAVATHARFADGPFGVHDAGVHFVAEAGITGGCGDGSNYCPDAPVTRAQMATFMRRLAGVAEGVQPSVNATAVDGLDGAALQQRVLGSCEPGNSIRAIGPGGTVTCGDQQTLVVQTVAEDTSFAVAFCPEGYVAVGGNHVIDSSAGPIAIPFAAGAGQIDGDEAYVALYRYEDGSLYPGTVTVVARCAYGSLAGTFRSSAASGRQHHDLAELVSAAQRERG